jgi:hypothetical protein
MKKDMFNTLNRAFNLTGHAQDHNWNTVTKGDDMFPIINNLAVIREYMSVVDDYTENAMRARRVSKADRKFYQHDAIKQYSSHLKEANARIRRIKNEDIIQLLGWLWEDSEEDVAKARAIMAQ